MTTFDSPWVTTKELLKYMRISRQTLMRRIESFKKGTDYRDINPANPKSPKVWHLQKCEKILSSSVVYR